MALLHRGAGSTGQEAGGLSLHLGYECGECQCWNGGPSARPWGCAVSWAEAGEGAKWAVDCWKDSADLVCLPCLKPPRCPQPGHHPSRCFRPVPGAVGVGTGKKPLVRTSAPSPAPLCSPSLPCHCVSPCRESLSQGAGGRCLVAVVELLIAANALGAFKPSPFWGRFLPFEMFPLPGIPRAPYLPLPAVQPARAGAPG